MNPDSTGVTTPRQSGMIVAPPAARQRIEAARLFALSGQIDSARNAAAALMLDDLAAFDADRRLLRQLIEVLLLCGGFRQISRLLRAIDGSLVAFLPATSAAASAEPFLLHADDATFTVMLDIREMQRPRAAALARAWSERILTATQAAAPAPAPTSRNSSGG
jgi:hypothetical protein